MSKKVPLYIPYSFFPGSCPSFLGAFYAFVFSPQHYNITTSSNKYIIFFNTEYVHLSPPMIPCCPHPIFTAVRVPAVVCFCAHRSSNNDIRMHCSKTRPHLPLVCRAAELLLSKQEHHAAITASWTMSNDPVHNISWCFFCHVCFSHIRLCFYSSLVFSR